MHGRSSTKASPLSLPLFPAAFAAEPQLPFQQPHQAVTQTEVFLLSDRFREAEQTKYLEFAAQNSLKSDSQGSLREVRS